MWRLVVPLLERDFTVALFDHVGVGRSDLSAWSPERYSTLDGYTDDVLEICREPALGPVTFVGHSVSAMMGVLAAAREPEAFAGLVLLAPSPCFIDDRAAGYRGGFSAEDIDELLESPDANYLGWSGAMAPVIMGNPERPELGEELTNSFCRTDPDIARVFARVTFLSDNREDLAEVGVPTLVAQCSVAAIRDLLDTFGTGVDDDTAVLAINVPRPTSEEQP
jgi:sigma-B regulation protein RsbQ